MFASPKVKVKMRRKGMRKHRWGQYEPEIKTNLYNGKIEACEKIKRELEIGASFTSLEEIVERLEIEFEVGCTPYRTFEYNKETFCCRHMVLLLYERIKLGEKLGLYPNLKLRIVAGDYKIKEEGHVWLEFQFDGLWYKIEATSFTLELNPYKHENSVKKWFKPESMKYYETKEEIEQYKEDLLYTDNEK